MVLTVSLGGCMGSGSDEYCDANNTSAYEEGSGSHFWRNMWLYHVFFGNHGDSGSSGSPYRSTRNAYSTDTGKSTGEKNVVDVADPVKKPAQPQKKISSSRRSFGRRR